MTHRCGGILRSMTDTERRQQMDRVQAVTNENLKVHSITIREPTPEELKAMEEFCAQRTERGA